MPIASAGLEVIIASASPQLTPVAPGIFLPKSDEVARVLALHEQVVRFVVSDHADRDVDLRGTHSPDVRLGCRNLLERRGQIIHR